MKTPKQMSDELGQWHATFCDRTPEQVIELLSCAEARADKAEAACKELQTLLSFAEPTRMPAHLVLDWHERRKQALAAVKE